MKADEQGSARVQGLRKAYAERVADLPAKDFVFLDECGVTTRMTRLYGRGKRGQRVYGAIPSNWAQSTTILGALTLEGLLTAVAIQATTSTEVFLAFLEQALVPLLRRGQVVVLDNLSAHKNPRVKSLIEAAGCQVLYLPPYSPDLNPIEPCWSKLKGVIRGENAREQGALETAIAKAMRSVTPENAQGWFRGMGYAT